MHISWCHQPVNSSNSIFWEVVPRGSWIGVALEIWGVLHTPCVAIAIYNLQAGAWKICLPEICFASFITQLSTAQITCLNFLFVDDYNTTTWLSICSKDRSISLLALHKLIGSKYSTLHVAITASVHPTLTHMESPTINFTTAGLKEGNVAEESFDFIDFNSRTPSIKHKDVVSWVIGLVLGEYDFWIFVGSKKMESRKNRTSR